MTTGGAGSARTSGAAPVVAVVLAGGAGTRMRPLTDRTPKPLLPVGGTPLVELQLEQLRRCGVGDVVLATGYRAEAFASLSRRTRPRVALSVEDEPRGTGGALGLAASALPPGPSDQCVVVLNGDLLTGHDLAAQVERLRRSPAHVQGAIHVRDVPDARPYGSVLADDDGVVTAFVEKSPASLSRTVNAGTYVLRRALLDDLAARRGPGGAQGAQAPVSLERDVFPGLADARALVAHREDAYFRDVGSPPALVAASVDAVTRGVPFEDRTTGRPAAVDPEAVVATTAEVTGGSSVLAGAVVEERAVIDGSVVMAGARVGLGAVVRRSVVDLDAEVPAGAVVEGGVVVAQ